MEKKKKKAKNGDIQYYPSTFRRFVLRNELKDRKLYKNPSHAFLYASTSTLMTKEKSVFGPRAHYNMLMSKIVLVKRRRAASAALVSVDGVESCGLSA